MINLNWYDVLFLEKKKYYFKKIIKFLIKSKLEGKIIYPKFSDIFNAFKFTKFNELKVVILGQDPYHQYNQANGLCFSINKENNIFPPSLLNIFKELKRDINFKYPNHGCLKKWAYQGILLLNIILSVEESKPFSHINIGWEIFTKNVIKIINLYKSKIIFLLWGSYVKKNILSLINKKKHFILNTSHPSPFSFNKGFYGCSHFSQTNIILRNEKKSIIDWQL